jgi:ABC-type polysaccharide/polyol phosphate transport system ATPase subunit
MTDPASPDRPAIVAEHLTKVYRLYEHPRQRILDVLGLSRRGKYTEHFALDDVTFSVRRGERLGIIGRNGAGKSTLLKLVSGVMPPTKGELRIDGNARALLEIGTGFHPEFTGRDNTKAYFAQLGIAGRQASELMAEVVAFAELEEYIDQPLKTYSTGMRVRLMFATATVVAPDILVLDEVLGVGDAYFTRKSFERINEMSRREGATLLLVSHDIYTSARICERMIWLEKGRVVFDGEPKEAIKAYEDSIRLQEEARLRAKSLLALERSQTGGRAKERTDALNLEIASPDGRPLAAPVWFRSARIFDGQEEVAALPLLGETPARGSLDVDGTCWGEIGEWEGAQGRPMQNFGSPFHRVSGNLVLPEGYILEGRELRLELEWAAASTVELLVSCRLGQHLIARHNVDMGGRHWEHYQLDLPDPGGDGTVVEGPQERAAVFGTGRIGISNARLLDGDGHETFNFWHGEPFRLLFDYAIRDPDLDESCDIAVSVLRAGVDTACRIFTRSLPINYGVAKQGTIEMTIDRVMLGAGPYSLNVQIARNGYYDQASASNGQLFFSINPDVHVSVRELIDFSVKARGAVAEGVAWVADGHWSLHETSSPSPAGNGAPRE